jgi:hypothetical protein
MSVRQVFARYGDPDYVLAPHRRPAARWLFFKSWLLALLLLLLLLLVNVDLVLRAENRHNVGAALAILGPGFAQQDYFLYRADEQGMFYTAERSVPNGFGNGWSSRALEVLPDANVQPDTEVITVTRGNHVEVTRIPRYFLFLSAQEYEAFILTYFTLLLMVPVLLTVVVVGRLVTHVARKFPANLYGLARAGRLLPAAAEERTGRVGPGNWRTYVEDLERALLHPVRWVLFALYLALFGGLMVALINPTDVTSTNLTHTWIYLVLGAAGGVFFMAYFLGVVIWELVVLVLFYQRLPAVFKLDIQPGHGDGCGGLARLGELSVLFGVIFSVPTIVLALLFLAGYLNLFSYLLIAALVVAAVLLPLGSVAFFWPLWRIHREMNAARESYQDEAVRRIAPVEQRLRRQLASGKMNDPETERLERLLDPLQMLYRAQGTYPTWPVSGAQFVGFFTAQIAPLAAALLTLVQIGDYLRPG